MKQLTTIQLAALKKVADTIAEIINDHPEGIPGGHLYARLMETFSLDSFNAMMRLLVDFKMITKRGEVYYPAPRTLH